MFIAHYVDQLVSVPQPVPPDSNSISVYILPQLAVRSSKELGASKRERMPRVHPSSIRLPDPLVQDLPGSTLQSLPPELKLGSSVADHLQLLSSSLGGLFSLASSSSASALWEHSQRSKHRRQASALRTALGTKDWAHTTLRTLVSPAALQRVGQVSVCIGGLLSPKVGGRILTR